MLPVAHGSQSCSSIPDYCGERLSLRNFTVVPPLAPWGAGPGADARVGIRSKDYDGFVLRRTRPACTLSTTCRTAGGCGILLVDLLGPECQKRGPSAVIPPSSPKGDPNCLTPPPLPLLLPVNAVPLLRSNSPTWIPSD